MYKGSICDVKGLKVGHAQNEEARTGCTVLFADEDVYKEVSKLSGGERARLMMLVIMLEKSNTLLLDEPTNHLDLSSKEALDVAVRDIDGTVILVSHDRYFLNKTADRILELTSDGVTSYTGNYNDYLEYKNSRDAEINLQKEKTTVSAAEEYELQKRRQANIKNITRKIEATEEKIAQTEEKIEKLQAQIAEAGSDYGRVSELFKESEGCEKELNDLYELWNTLGIELESYQ